MTEDELIRQIWERAHDPARRMDLVRIPLAELAQTTDPSLAELRRRFREDLYLFTIVPGGSPEAVAFYRDFLREPAFPPVPLRELERRERELGVHFPLLLRRLYTEVGDGGFGPMYGILGIGKHGHGDEYRHTAGDLYQTWTSRNDYRCRLGWPVCYYGCDIYGFVSLTEQGNPVRVWDPSKVEGNHLETGIILTRPTLADWLEDWLLGRDHHPELVEIDLIRHIAIRGRMALALTCVERAMDCSGVRDERIVALVNALWGFVEGNLADADNAWREAPAADLLDVVEGKEGILESYPDLPSLLPKMLYDTVDLAEAEMYHAVEGYSEESLGCTISVLRLCEQNHVPLPPIEVFARLPFIVGGSEDNQWGPDVPRTFFAEATKSPNPSESSGDQEMKGE